MRNPLITRIDTPDAQGDGSYLYFRRLTWGERRTMLKEIMDLEGEPLEDYVFQIIIDHLEKWNWKDADGVDLQLPKERKDFNESYTEEEIKVLFQIAGDAIQGRITYTKDAEKN